MWEPMKPAPPVTRTRSPCDRQASFSVFSIIFPSSSCEVEHAVGRATSALLSDCGPGFGHLGHGFFRVLHKLPYGLPAVPVVHHLW